MRASTRTTSALCAALALAFAAAVPAASAGTVILLNDEEIDGEILDVGVDFVVIRVPGGRQSIPMREVRDVIFRAGESMWEQKLKTALARAKEEKDRLRRQRLDEEKRRIEEELRRAGVSAEATTGASAAPPPPVSIPIPIGTTNLPPEVLRLGGVHDGEHYFVRFPGGFHVSAVDADYATFQDDRGATPWTFNITFFHRRDEGDYEAIRTRAQNELERVPLYRAKSRGNISVGRETAERTLGLYERLGRAVRHDQVVVPCTAGTLVIHFFSPGATMEEGAVPDIEAVIKSLVVK
jgi:hypothetical protein